MERIFRYSNAPRNFTAVHGLASRVVDSSPVPIHFHAVLSETPCPLDVTHSGAPLCPLQTLFPQVHMYVLLAAVLDLEDTRCGASCH